MTPEEIKELRIKLKLSQEGLARILGVSYLSVNRWENNKVKMCPMSLNKIKSLMKKSDKK